MIVTGSCDMKCRVFSAFIPDLDKTPNSGPFKDMASFGEPMAEFGNSKGWVEAVAWAPKGNRLAFTGNMNQYYCQCLG
jgi:hypothetical protein